MVKKKQLSKFLHKRWDAIADTMNHICEVCNQETLHQIRVNAKKIKALLQLLNACSKHEKTFSAKRLKGLFHHAGEIRTAQLNEAMFTEYQLPCNNLKEEQHSIIVHESKVLCERSASYSNDIKKLERKFTQKLTRIKDKKILSYYNQNLETLSFNFTAPIDPDVLHDSRKLIKNLLYALKALPSSLVQKLNLNENYLDNLQDLIGQWHDAEITLAMLMKTGNDMDAGYEELALRKQKLFEAIQHLTESFNIRVINKEPEVVAA